ncbi:hypothetical protein EWH99_04445 [Sporolactobacillus sp. THM7-7]|nr:hypothetical protein EWH99_04445 [Sporolactobacillus sp. THM7-7]
MKISGGDDVPLQTQNQHMEERPEQWLSNDTSLKTENQHLWSRNLLLEKLNHRLSAELEVVEMFLKENGMSHLFSDWPVLSWDRYGPEHREDQQSKSISEYFGGFSDKQYR